MRNLASIHLSRQIPIHSRPPPARSRPAALSRSRWSPPGQGGIPTRPSGGDPDAPPRGRLARFPPAELSPRHDIVFDIHSGGTSMAHLPSALIERDADPARHAKALAL